MKRELVTRLSPEECLDRIAARMILGHERYELQRRWHRPPVGRPVTGMVHTSGFTLQKTLPVYATEPALWGEFERIPTGTRISAHMTRSMWSGFFGAGDVPTSPVRRLLWMASINFTSLVMKIASSVAQFRMQQHEEFLIQFLRETLDATEVQR